MYSITNGIPTKKKPYGEVLEVGGWDASSSCMFLGPMSSHAKMYDK